MGSPCWYGAMEATVRSICETAYGVWHNDDRTTGNSQYVGHRMEQNVYWMCLTEAAHRCDANHRFSRPKKETSERMFHFKFSHSFCINCNSIRSIFSIQCRPASSM